MEVFKTSLCPQCDQCPEVEIAGETVKIGETGNVVVLQRDEWNVLVELVRSGKLTTL
jgi:hypothetical protein